MPKNAFPKSLRVAAEKAEQNHFTTFLSVLAPIILSTASTCKLKTSSAKLKRSRLDPKLIIHRRIFGAFQSGDCGIKENAGEA